MVFHIFASFNGLLASNGGIKTEDIMEDPVVAADGVSYERYAIELWWRNGSDSKSPEFAKHVTGNKQNYKQTYISNPGPSK